MKTKIIIFFLRLFSSCKGILKISGKIISGKTKAPIEGARIELFDIHFQVPFDSPGNSHGSSVLSDENGNFISRSGMRGMLFDLPEYLMRITKSGYQVLEIKINLKDKKGSGLYELIEN